MISSCCLDIECSSLKGNFGVILVGVVKAPRKKPVIFRGDELCPNWAEKRSDDQPVIKAILEEIAKYRVVIAHNGADHDIPFLRTRMLHWGMGVLPRKKLLDLCKISRQHLKLSSNSLDSLVDFFGLKLRRMHVSGQQWVRACLDGDRNAMDEITEKCVRDTVLLEEVAKRLADYAPVINEKGSS